MKPRNNIHRAVQTVIDRARTWLGKPKKNVARSVLVVVDGLCVASAHDVTVDVEDTGLIVGPKWTDTRKIRHMKLERVRWASADPLGQLTDAFLKGREVQVQIVCGYFDRAFNARVASIGGVDGLASHLKLVGEEWVVSL